MDQSEWLPYIKAAQKAGCPRDQIERFCQAGYIATPKQLEFHAATRLADTPGKAYIFGQGGTRGSAKSHCGFAQAAIDDSQRIDNLKGLVLRQTQKAVGEQFQDLTDKILRNVDCEKNTEKITYPNGSKIIIGGYKDEKEIDKYVGLEYDWILVFELGQIPGDRIIKIRGSLRTSKPNWVPRLYADFNVGGKGYAEVKKLFINPWREKREKETRFFERWYQDNPFINPEYRDYLGSLTGYLRRIWVDNDWDVFAGQAFSELSPDIHGFDKYPADWDKWPTVACMDWGYDKPYAIYLAKMDYDGRFWIFYELYGYGGEANVGTHETVEIVVEKYSKDLTRLKVKPEISLAGPDFFAKGSGAGMMIAKAYTDVFRERGIYLTEMATPGGSRIQGKMAFHSRLGGKPGELPGLMIHKTDCPHFWRTLPTLVYAENGSGDISNDPNTDEDHSYDCIRHLCRWRAWGKPIKETPKEQQRDQNMAEFYGDDPDPKSKPANAYH